MQDQKWIFILWRSCGSNQRRYSHLSKTRRETQQTDKCAPSKKLETSDPFLFAQLFRQHLTSSGCKQFVKTRPSALIRRSKSDPCFDVDGWGRCDVARSVSCFREHALLIVWGFWWSCFKWRDKNFGNHGAKPWKTVTTKIHYRVTQTFRKKWQHKKETPL